MEPAINNRNKTPSFLKKEGGLRRAIAINRNPRLPILPAQGGCKSPPAGRHGYRETKLFLFLFF